MVSGPGAGSDACLSRVMLLVTAASFPVATPNAPLTFLRMLAGLPNNPSPQEPSAMDTSTDPPSLKDDTLDR